MNKNNNNIMLAGLILIFVLIGCSPAAPEPEKPEPAEPAEEPAETPSSLEPETSSPMDIETLTPIFGVEPAEFFDPEVETTIVFGGDVMHKRKGIFSDVDFQKTFEHIGPVLKSADIASINLEMAVCETLKEDGTWRDFQHYNTYKLFGDPQDIGTLRQNGVDIAVIANNDAYNFGEVCFSEMLETFKQNGMNEDRTSCESDEKICYIGGGSNTIEATKPIVINNGGTNFVFLAFADIDCHHYDWIAREDHTGIAPMYLRQWNEETEKWGGEELSQIDQYIKKIKDPNSPDFIENAFIIVQFHVCDLRAHKYDSLAAWNGADLIVDHGYHKLDDVWFEGPERTPIFQDLGNLVFDDAIRYGEDSTELNRRHALVEVVVKNREITGVNIFPFYSAVRQTPAPPNKYGTDPPEPDIEKGREIADRFMLGIIGCDEENPVLSFDPMKFSYTC
ncbi:MAG: CapA family protein [Nanoarchaeota archaeon]|nr:CapA family protein [Nanoarchaeota archaeon]